MKKIIVTTAASLMLALGLSAAPASAAAPEPCQEQLAIGDVCTIDQFTFDPLHELVQFLESRLDSLRAQIYDLQNQLEAKDQKIADQRSSIKHLRAQVRRLRH